MPQVFANNLVARLAHDIDDLTQVFELVLLSGTWPYLVSGADYFLLTLSDAAGSFEIVRVTGISGDTVTVTRGREQTPRRAWLAAGTIVSGRLTAGTLVYLENMLAAYAGPAPAVPSAVSPREFGALPVFAGAGGRPVSANCSLAMQAAIDFVCQVNTNAGLQRVVLIIDDYYACSGLTYGSNFSLKQTALPKQGGFIAPAGSAAGWVLKNADPEVINISIKDLYINGNRANQTNVVGGFSWDQTGIANPLMLSHGEVSGLFVEQTTGRGIHIGPYCRASRFEGLTSRFSDEVGLYYSASDSRLDGFDVSQSSGGGFVWDGAAGHIANGKVWASGRYAGGSTSKGYSIRKGNVTIVNCEAQENGGYGWEFFRSGTRLRNIIAIGLTSDSDNVGATGLSAFNMFNIEGSFIQGTVGKFNAGLAGTPARVGSISGGSTGNTLDVKSYGAAASTWGINADSADNNFVHGEPARLTPATFGATGTGDDRSAIVAWLAALSTSGLPGFVDKDYSFASTIGHSGDVTIRGPFSDKARLIYTGTGDGLELTGKVDLDGLVIDGNLASNAVPTNTSEAGCLLGIHGAVSGTPAYLDGVRIGRLRVQNTRRRTGLALVNLSNAKIERLETLATYGHAMHFCGLKDVTIASYKFDKVGNLAADGSRLGAGIAFFEEGNAGKLPAGWYVAAGVLPTDNVMIGPGDGSRTTDSAIYLHDTYGSGIKNVTFGHFNGQLLGKDGMKARDGATGIRFNGATLRKVGLRFVSLDAGNGTNDNNQAVGIHGREAGYDVIGEWLDGSPGSRNYTTAANGLGQTLNQAPGGFLMNGVKNCVMTGSARAVRDAPHDGGEGTPGNFISLTDCIIDLTADDSDRYVLLRALTRCKVTLNVTNACRNLVQVAAPVICDDTGAESNDNVLRVYARERSGAAVMQYPCRIDGTGTKWDIGVEYNGPFTQPSSLVLRCDAAEVNYRNVARKAFRTGLAFDGSGQTVVTHNLGVGGTTPSFGAMLETVDRYGIRIIAVTTSTVTLQLYTLADPTVVVPSVTRTVNWWAELFRQSGGFQF